MLRLAAAVPVALLSGWMLLVLPVQGVVRYRRLAAGRPPGGLLADYRSGIVRKWALTAAVLAALAFQGVWPARIGLSTQVRGGRGGLVAAGAALLLGAALTVVLRRRRALRRRLLRPVAAILPVTMRERRVFALLAVTAGVTEEICYRGFLAHEAAAAGLPPAAALVAVSAAFGLAHLYQGLAGVAGTALAGYALGGLAASSGSLVLPIVLHVLVDLRVLVLLPPGTLIPTTRPASQSPGPAGSPAGRRAGNRAAPR